MKFSDYFPVYRKNLALAVPVIFSQIGQVTVNITDNIMVGHLGTTELAAASFAINIFHIGMLFGLGVSLGLTPLVGQSINSKAKNNLGNWLRNGVLVNLLVSLILCGVMGSVVFFMPQMGQSVEVVNKAIPFYLLHVVSLIPLLMFFSFKQFLEGIGNTRIAMVITVTINLINIILNYGLIYGKLGLPALGLNGSGIATLIARLVMPGIFVVVMLKRPSFRIYLAEAFHSAFDKLKIKRIVSIGLPVGIQMVIEVLAFSLGAIMLGWISKESLAGHQVAISMVAMTYMISFGLASGTTIRVSHAVGENDYKEVRQSIVASLHLVIIFMSTMGVLFILLQNQLPLLFTSDPAVIKVAAGLLVVGAFFQIFDGIQVVLLGALRGIADVRIPMIMAFFSYIVVSLPVSYLLAFVFKLGYSGVWMGLVGGLSTAAVLFGLRLKKSLKK